jgi:general secretion pathway protein L
LRDPASEYDNGRKLMISRAFEWWSEGLAGALLIAERSIHRPRRYQLRTQTSPFTLRAIDGDETGASVRLPDPGHAPYPEDILQKTRDSIIEIVVPLAAILTRRLAPLPSESRLYVENIVRHQLEAILPWSADNILHTTLVHDREDGRIEVSVWATTRLAVAQALAAATACGASEIVIVGDGANADAQDSVAIPVSSSPSARSKISKIRPIARYAVAAVVVLAVGIVGWTSFVRWSLSSDVAALDQAVADRRAILRRASDPRGTSGSDLDARKRQTTIAVVVLESLSAALPDDTYLTELSLDTGRIRITGISARPTELITRLEGSTRFKNASFYAPTTRMPGGTTDRFSIEATVVPQLQVTP